MNNWIGTVVKLWNVAIYEMNQKLRHIINTTTYHFGQYLFVSPSTKNSLDHSIISYVIVMHFTK